MLSQLGLATIKLNHVISSWSTSSFPQMPTIYYRGFRKNLLTWSGNLRSSGCRALALPWPKNSTCIVFKLWLRTKESDTCSNQILKSRNNRRPNTAVWVYLPLLKFNRTALIQLSSSLNSIDSRMPRSLTSGVDDCAKIYGKMQKKSLSLSFT